MNKDKFHSHDRGCKLLQINLKRSDVKDPHGEMECVYCETHEVLCSKTGWEMGWYQGTESKKLE